MDLGELLISLCNNHNRLKSRMITMCETWCRSCLRPTHCRSTGSWFRIRSHLTRKTRNHGSSTTSWRKSAKIRSRIVHIKSAAFLCQTSARWKVPRSSALVYDLSQRKSAWLQCLSSTSAETRFSTRPRLWKWTLWRWKTKIKVACSQRKLIKSKVVVLWERVEWKTQA